ncbi:hypothetical protein Tco_0769736 [Tanacetum coccineum]|uniref:Uncharacterized protein n=1 Tax=Tanacetum coccineum TaxID=301880 RepID=A0ABQ4ZDI5_9ASTR
MWTAFPQHVNSRCSDQYVDQSVNIRLDHQELKKVIWYVLDNSPKIDTYLAKFKSWNDLDFATLNIDGQSTDVEAPPNIIDVNEDNDFIDDEDDVPHDLAHSDDEVVANDDEDDVAVIYSSEEEMSAAVARGYGGGDDPSRPLPRPIHTGCRGGDDTTEGLGANTPKGQDRDAISTNEPRGAYTDADVDEIKEDNKWLRKELAMLRTVVTSDDRMSQLLTSLESQHEACGGSGGAGGGDDEPAGMRRFKACYLWLLQSWHHLVTGDMSPGKMAHVAGDCALKVDLVNYDKYFPRQHLTRDS